MPTTVSVLPDAEPMPLRSWREAFDGADWMFEPHYDGFRALLYLSGDGCELRARQDSHFAGRSGVAAETLFGFLPVRLCAE